MPFVILLALLIFSTKSMNMTFSLEWARHQVMMCDWRGSDVAVGKIRFEMVFDVRSLEDLAQEITLLVRLSHPSLVRMFGVTENAPGIVLEHLKTGTLFAYRRERDPSLFTPALLMRIASQIAKGTTLLLLATIFVQPLPSSAVIDRYTILDVNWNRCKVPTF